MIRATQFICEDVPGPLPRLASTKASGFLCDAMCSQQSNQRCVERDSAPSGSCLGYRVKRLTVDRDEGPRDLKRSGIKVNSIPAVTSYLASTRPPKTPIPMLWELLNSEDICDWFFPDKHAALYLGYMLGDRHALDGLTNGDPPRAA